MSAFTRRAAIALFMLAALPLLAQYQTPTVDGVVDGGEYAHSSGNWYVTWDATYLYIAKTNLSNTNNGVEVYLDIDPQSTPTAGSNSNGNTAGTTDFGVQVDRLPFRADARVLGTPTPEIKSRDGSGSWGSADTSSSNIIQATSGSTRELRVRWTALAGLSGVPSSFRWFGYEVSTSTIADPMPSANSSGTGISTIAEPYAFSISSTADGSSTDPFSVQESTWYVTNNSPTFLNAAILMVNGDTSSSRRFIVFNTINNNTITTSSDLTEITQTTTIDGTTAPGYSSTPVLVIVGFSTNINNDHGVRTNGCTSCVIRGLVLQTHGLGITITNGSSTSVVGNYIGTSTSGTTAMSNNVGIRLTGCTSCTIGGTTTADRNLISGNTGGGVSAVNTTSLTVQGNYVGTKANGTEALTNPVGISLISAHSTLVGGTTTGMGNVINSSVDAAVYSESSNDVSIYGNLMGVGADGTTALGGGNGVFAIGGSRLTIGATAAASRNTISHFGAAVLTDISTGLSIRGNAMVDNDFAIDLAGSVVQPAPTVSTAQVQNGNLQVIFSLTSNSSSATTQSMLLDVYDADTTGGAPAEGKLYRATSQCYSGSSLTDQVWDVGSGYSVGDKIVFIATSYSDANCTTPGDGSSQFTSVITTTTGKTFTGPGSFSDTSKWSGSALPIAGQDFLILNSCTFDSGSPTRAYGDMAVGNGTTSGNLSWPGGNAVVLDVDDIVIGAGNTGTAIDMTNAATLRVRGNMTVGTNDFIGGASTVEFTGTGKTVTSSAAIFHNVTITGTLSIGNTFYVNGALNVQSGATFSGSGSTTLYPRTGANILGSGTKSFGQINIESGQSVTASANFSASSTFTNDGTFTPTSTTVISGTGTIGGSGTMKVTRTGSAAMSNQYTLTINLASNTVEYSGTGASQTISAPKTYFNLKINNSSGVTLSGGDVTVTGVLNLAAGLAQGTGNDFIVTNSSPSAVIQGAGWTRLTFRRTIATGTNTYLYPIGPAAGLQSVNVTFNNVTVSGVVRMIALSLNANQIGGGSGIDISHDASGTWQIENNSATFTSYDVTINFGTLYDAGSDPTRFVLRRYLYSTEQWSTVPAAVPAATSISVAGETLSEVHVYAAGNQEIDHYVVSASSSQTAGVAFNTTVTAYDVKNVLANVDGRVVTMTSSTGNAQFDSDGNGTFDDNTKSVTNGTFTISTKDNPAESFTLTATDTSSKTGTSSTITTNPQVFTGPGSFSDTSKWSQSALPASGVALQILGACTFDNAAPTRTYSSMTLGNGITAGSVSWQAGNSVVLDVDDVTATTAGVVIDMTNGGTLRVRGNMALASSDLTGGSGTVEFTGSGKTLSSVSNAAIFHNITVTGTLTFDFTLYFNGTLDVQTGATLTGGSSTILYPRNGAAIGGSGTRTFGQINIASGQAVTASASFSASSTFTNDGTFTPTSSTVISGTGTIGGSGTMKVTRTGSNALTNQYTLTLDTTNNTVEYAGSGSSQSLQARTYKNLTFNNSSGFLLFGNITITSTLNFAAGSIQGNGNEFYVTNSAPSAVTATAGWTRAILHWAFATGTNTYVFPVGTTSASRPVTVTFHNVTVAGQMKILATSSVLSNYGGSGLDVSKDANGAWTTAFESGTAGSFDVSFEFGSGYDAGATPTTFALRRYNNTTEVWADAPGIPAATSISATGQTPTTDTLSWVAGNQLIDHYVVSASSPQSAGTPFTTTVTAQDFLNITANVSSTVVTMTSNTTHAQFDSDGNGTFGDNTKSLTNGTFTISTKDNTIESVTLTATDTNSKTGTSSAITVNLGPASTATSTISASPTTISTNGATSTITVQLKDAGGNNLTSSGGTVALSTNLGSLGAVTNNNDGTYTATLTSGSTSGTATISGTLNAAPLTNTATVTFTGPPDAPASITATATSTTNVAISWPSVSGATSYEVYRSSLNAPYAFLGSTSGTSLGDSAVNANTTYLYKVRALGTGGTGNFSPIDAATTVVFTDTSLTLIKAVHFTEVRTAVNLMRAAAGLSAATFTNPSLSGEKIRAVHLTEIRTALDQARSAAGMTALTYTDSTITAGVTAVKAVHVTEIRAAVQ